MKEQTFIIGRDGFTGHLALPEAASDRGVIVVSGGEKSLLPGRLLARRFAQYGITALTVSLFGGEGLPAGPDRVPVDMFEPAVRYLREELGCGHISTYGMSMGSIFALLCARYVPGIENVVLVSPTHVPFEGSADKKHMSGHSVATWRGEELPFIPLDLERYKPGRYYPGEADHPVTGMWCSYRDAYRDKEAEMAAYLRPEELPARVLLLAGDCDEAWPSDYSVSYMARRLREAGRGCKAVLYPRAGHLLGVMPNREENRWLYRAIPLIGLMYRSFRADRGACMAALNQSEHETISWIKGDSLTELPGQPSA